MQARYRKDYIGEFIIPTVIFSGGGKQEVRQWVDSSITVAPTRQALCSGDGTTVSFRTYQVKDNLITVEYDTMVTYSTELNPQTHTLVPYNPRFTAQATAAYLAAFDGAEEIFLLGYDNNTSDLQQVIQAYPGVMFTFIDDELVTESNTRSITQAEFIEQYSAAV